MTLSDLAMKKKNQKIKMNKNKTVCLHICLNNSRQCSREDYYELVHALRYDKVDEKEK